MKLEPADSNPGGAGVTLFGIVLMLSIIGAFALLLWWVIPGIRQEGLDKQRLVDISSIRQALTAYIDNNDSIPKSWADVQDQIDLDHYSNHYDVGDIFKSLDPEDIAGVIDTARQAAEEVRDYVGVFARAQCDQPWVENAANTSLIKSGNDNQIAVLYMLEGVGLVCEQIGSEPIGEPEAETTPGTDGG